MTTDQDRKSLADRMLMQTLATCNNYYHTGQYNKALSVLNKLKEVFPNEGMIDILTSATCHAAFEDQIGKADIDPMLTEVFGKNWTGEDLEGKSIVVFYDQEISDAISLIGHLKSMKDKWDCKISFNCYAHYNSMNSFMKCFDFMSFDKDFITTDYHTNIMNIPDLFNIAPTGYLEQLLNMKVPTRSIDNWKRKYNGAI